MRKIKNIIEANITQETVAKYFYNIKCNFVPPL
jgi:hypothetical protein